MGASINVYKAIEEQKTATFKSHDGTFVYVVNNKDFPSTMKRMLGVKNLERRELAANIAKQVSDTFEHDQADWVKWRFEDEYQETIDYKIHCHVILFKDGMWAWVPLVKATATIYPFYEDGTYYEGYDSEKDYWENIIVGDMFMKETVWATFDFSSAELNVVGARNGDTFNVNFFPLFDLREGYCIPDAFCLERKYMRQVRDTDSFKAKVPKKYDNYVIMWS